MTAIRETFEETGLLVASSSTGALPSDSVLDTARELIHSQKQLFQDFLAQHGISLNTGALLPFTQWITPPTQVRWGDLKYECNFVANRLQAIPYLLLRNIPGYGTCKRIHFRREAAPSSDSRRRSRSHFCTICAPTNGDHRA